jgi:hypothetical protein
MYPANGATFAGGTHVSLYLVPHVSERGWHALRVALRMCGGELQAGP